MLAALINSFIISGSTKDYLDRSKPTLLSISIWLLCTRKSSLKVALPLTPTEVTHYST